MSAISCHTSHYDPIDVAEARRTAKEKRDPSTAYRSVHDHLTPSNTVSRTHRSCWIAVYVVERQIPLAMLRMLITHMELKIIIHICETVPEPGN